YARWGDWLPWGCWALVLGGVAFGVFRRRSSPGVATPGLRSSPVFERIMNRFLFRPVLHTREWVEPPAGLPLEDVVLTGADGRRVHAWWTTPDGWHPSRGALLYCHGNAGNLSYRGEGLRRWRDLMGQAVLIFDYPGYGRSEGRPGEAGCYAAA